MVKVGEEKQAKIIKLNAKDKKISLSFRQAVMDLQRQEYQRYQDNQGERLTFGDLIREQLNKKNNPPAEVPAPVETPAPAAVSAPVEAVEPAETAAPAEISAPAEAPAPEETTAPVNKEEKSDD